MPADVAPGRAELRGKRRRGANGKKRAASGRPASSPKPGFVLYVEGPRDRDLLRIWARRVSHGLAKGLDGRVVILGGRQPARAVDHFRSLREKGTEDGAEITGLVVLDHDQLDEPVEVKAEPGLDLFMWARRHIESYVLVPSAIKRAAGGAIDDSRMDRFLAEHLPADRDPSELRELDAKRFLAGKGPLSRAIGRTLATPDIARCMRTEEIHQDVIDLLERLRVGFGLNPEAPAIVRRGRFR